MSESKPTTTRGSKGWGGLRPFLITQLLWAWTAGRGAAIGDSAGQQLVQGSGTALWKLMDRRLGEGSRWGRRLSAIRGGAEIDDMFRRMRAGRRVRKPGTSQADWERSAQPEPSSINVTVLSWNMGMASPSMSDMALLSTLGLNESHILVLGVQEVENIKPRRHEGSRSREWRRLVLKTFSKTHALLSLTSMGPLQLVVLAKRQLLRHISPLHVCQVPCGIGNVFYNKGAQAALFKVCGTSLLFINAHLAAHQHKVEERNAAVDRIFTEIQHLLWFHLRRPGQGDRRPGGSSFRGPRLPPPPHTYIPDDLLHKVDRFFLLGDLNYRLELPREDIEVAFRRVKAGRVQLPDAIARLLEYDQLAIEKEKGRVFSGLEEGPIMFAPTFKYNKRRDGFDTTPKRRAPAWTDRVLFKGCGGAVRLTKYDSVQQCKHSDHRPVYASFEVDVGSTDRIPPLDEPAALKEGSTEMEEVEVEAGGIEENVVSVPRVEPDREGSGTERRRLRVRDSRGKGGEGPDDDDHDDEGEEEEERKKARGKGNEVDDDEEDDEEEEHVDSDAAVTSGSDDDDDDDEEEDEEDDDDEL